MRYHQSTQKTINYKTAFNTGNEKQDATANNNVIDPIKIIENIAIWKLPLATNGITAVSKDNYVSTRWATSLHERALIERKKGVKTKNTEPTA